jgi:glycosyltransferase involved in cell wall biosynthesis
MNNTPSITVLIASKDYGMYIERAIQSALSQTLLPGCICVIDDGSQDDSWNRICKYANENLRQEEIVDSPIGAVTVKIGNVGNVDIVAIRLPVSVGPSEARNYGIDITMPTTEFYAILDADDEFLPTKLEKCIKPFQNKNVGVVYANYYLIDSDTGTSTLEIKRPYDIFLLQSECIVHSGALIRAELLKKLKDENGYYDRNMRTCEDYDLWIRASKYCSFYHIPEPLTNVLVHANNSTNSVDKSVWESNWKRIAEKGAKTSV